MKRIIRFINYFFIGFSYLANQKIFAILTVALFFCLLDVSSGFQEELRMKEKEMIFEKGKDELKYYQDSGLEEISISKNIAAIDLENCFKNSIDENSVGEAVQKQIQELKELYGNNQEYFSFLYQDLYSGFTVSYNEEEPIFTASTIKAPAMIYLYEQASEGKIDLNEKLVYTSNFYSGGSGVLQTLPVNTSYTVNQLIEYAIHDSDNIAYAMLMNRFKRENVLDFWQKKGTKQIFTLNTIWGVTSAKDASIYMKELYQFYLNNDSYGNTLMEYFKNAEWKLITNQAGEFQTANKGGWSGVAIHDVAIIFDKNPYILVIMSNTGESNYTYLFQKTSQLVGKLHEEYWKYKEKICSEIKQY